MNVLLTTLNAKYIHTNLAIRLLYQLNKDKKGVNLNWHEFTIKQDFNEIAYHCSPYDIVAFSCYIWNISQTLEVAKRVKKLNPETKILLGGPEVSYEFEEFINYPYIDFIISGEGEIPFEEFLNRYPSIELVPNLIFKKDSEIIFNKSNISFDVKKLDGINPYCNDSTYELKNKILYLETSRGCPYKCEFCLAGLDNKVRYVPMSTIKQNLLFMMEHGRIIKFLDRTFNVKKDFTLEVFEFILLHHKPENVFQFEITADILHPDIIKYINERVPYGLFRFEIGIQTVNQRANLEVSRKQNFEKTKNVILAIRDKIELHLDLIVGLPLDYLEDIKHSINEVFSLYPPELQLGFLKFLRGTPVKEKHEKHGFVFDPNPPYQIIKSNYLSSTELKDIEILEHMLEIYWNKKRAINTLKYIAEHESIADFFIKLGKFFMQENDLIRYTQDEVYLSLFNFLCSNNYPQAVIDLLVFDYALSNKIKPKPLFNPPLNFEATKKLNKTLNTTTDKKRVVYYQLSINPLEPDKIEPHLVQFNYTGTQKPKFNIWNLKELNF